MKMHYSKKQVNYLFCKSIEQNIKNCVCVLFSSDRSGVPLKSVSSKMSANLVSSVESIHRNIETDSKRKNAQLSQEELNSIKGMDEKSNENIYLISARKSHRLKTVKKFENLDNEEDYDTFWVETGKTRLGLQFERFI
jgi:hypothetical protein